MEGAVAQGQPPRTPQQWDEAERAEREERRGLEARGGVLLAAGAGLVGLLATALPTIELSGSERQRVLDLFAAGTAVMVVSLAIAAWALSRGMVDIRSEGDPSAQEAAPRIRASNKRLVSRLGWSTMIFAGAIVLYLWALVWAAFASTPAAKPKPAVACVTYVRELDELADDEPLSAVQAAMSKDSRSSVCGPVSLSELRRH